MAVLINFKICDNAKECNGVAVCPTGALSWDNKKKTIVIDNSKCTSCGICEKACMVGAITVAKTKEEYNKIQKEIKNDTRKISDLFVDKYGAKPIHPAFLISQDKFQKEVKEADRLTVAEVFNQESIMCLLRSISISYLLEDKDAKYRKVELKDKTLLREYKLKTLPALLIFNQGKLLGKIEGYFDTDNQMELKRKLDKILNKK